MKNSTFTIQIVVVLVLIVLSISCGVDEPIVETTATKFLTESNPTGTNVPNTPTPNPMAAPTKTLVSTTLPISTPLSEAEEDTDLSVLREDLAVEIGNYGVSGEYAVAVTDLQTGETISVNGHRPQLSGCVINFFPILASVVGVQNGVYLEEQVGDLISATVWSSNPHTARSLYSIIGEGDVVAGVASVDGFITDQLGLTETIIDHPPAYPGETLGINANNWTTAEDVNIALAILYSGNLLTPEWREYLLAKMVVKPGLNYLTAYGTGGVVRHKNGFFVDENGWIDNDIGIVIFERGDNTYAYAISFFSQKVTQKYGDIALGQSVSEMVWSYFSNKYR